MHETNNFIYSGFHGIISREGKGLILQENTAVGSTMTPILEGISTKEN